MRVFGAVFNCKKRNVQLITREMAKYILPSTLQSCCSSTSSPCRTNTECNLPLSVTKALTTPSYIESEGFQDYPEPMADPKCVVIGAGPAGLTLARLLQKSGIRCTVYEAEKDRGTRDQGGSLDLHVNGGQLALKEACLFEQFRNHSRPEGQALKLVRYDGEVLWDENEMGNSRPTEEDDRPEIDRVKLRDILIDSVDPGTIKWGNKVLRVEADPKAKGKHTVTFADGSKETDIDLLVGADGARSKVRPLLTDVRPHYSGITGIELWSLDVTKRNPWLSNYVGAGSCFMFDEGRAMMCQRNGNDSIRMYACVRQPETWKDDCGIDWTDPEAARRTMVEKYFYDCSSDIKRLIIEGRDECIMRQMWMLPVGHTWETRPGGTPLGDAAHLMTPSGGVGVNVAITDALQLARQLIARRDSFVAKAFSDTRNIEIAVKAYEKEMFENAKRNAEKTYKGLVGHFAKNGGQELADKFKAFHALKAGEDYNYCDVSGVLAYM